MVAWPFSQKFSVLAMLYNFLLHSAWHVLNNVRFLNGISSSVFWQEHGYLLYFELCCILKMLHIEK